MDVFGIRERRVDDYRSFTSAFVVHAMGNEQGRLRGADIALRARILDLSQRPRDLLGEVDRLATGITPNGWAS